ncbi:MAG: hypothetical protein HYY24_25055 [Verrucomicrobia bacterium]|nr:hypothetical protein [Verrucomicrobiota bacterium]
MCTLTENQFAEAQVLADVSEWTGRGPLVSLILDVTSAVEWPRPAGPAAGLGQAGPRPQMLLTLLTYCYATGCLGSDDIERGAARNPTLRYLCAGAHPSSEQVRRFRRGHRTLITRCLRKALLSAWQFRLWLGLAQEAGADLPEWLGPDTWSDAEAAAFFARAAQQRVDHAVRLDSMALDD